MQDDLERIRSLIPHRDPFLWVDRIISYTNEEIVTEKTLSEDLDVFKGHYPGHPIMPGVLLCEAIFQSGALLMALDCERSANPPVDRVPVLTKITGAKFRQPVLPGDTVSIHVKRIEELSSVIFFKGTLKRNGKLAVRVEFNCTLTPVSQ